MKKAPAMHCWNINFSNSLVVGFNSILEFVCVCVVFVRLISLGSPNLYLTKICYCPCCCWGSPQLILLLGRKTTELSPPTQLTILKAANSIAFKLYFFEIQHDCMWCTKTSRYPNLCNRVGFCSCWVLNTKQFIRRRIFYRTDIIY